jgi:hypothetical protein
MSRRSCYTILPVFGLSDGLVAGFLLEPGRCRAWFRVVLATACGFAGKTQSS